MLQQAEEEQPWRALLSFTRTGDPEAGVWVATTPDIRGLVTEAETLEALRAKLPGMILDLLEEAGVSDLPASIEIIARASDRFAAAK